MKVYIKKMKRVRGVWAGRAGAGYQNTTILSPLSPTAPHPPAHKHAPSTKYWFIHSLQKKYPSAWHSLFGRCPFSVIFPRFLFPICVWNREWGSSWTSKSLYWLGNSPIAMKGEKEKYSLRCLSPYRLLRPRQVIILCNITHDHDRGAGGTCWTPRDVDASSSPLQTRRPRGRPRPCTSYDFSSTY